MSLNKVLINTNQVAEFPEISYIDNPEFAFVKMDNESRVLYGVKQDGEFFFGAGCPLQVRNYVEQKLAELSLDEYEDIVEFLSDYLGSDTTLKVMIDSINASKVDKEENKSLIDSGYASTKSSIENPEFLEATTDSENKVVFGIKRNGKIFISDIENKDISLLLSHINTNIIVANEINSIDSFGTPETCLSTADNDVTPYDNIYMGYNQVLKISDEMYYMYYDSAGNGDDFYEYQGIVYADTQKLSLKFAYSTDGLNWTRGYPQGIDIPEQAFGRNACVFLVDGTNRGVGSCCVIKAYWDTEYPFRAISSDGSMYMWKSRDGVTFTDRKLIDDTWRDCQPSAIVRGNIIKVYNRHRSASGRFISVLYTDLDGNVLSPSRYLFGENNLYQSSGGMLDERRDILFPTTFKQTNLAPYDKQGIACYIVDGNEVLQVPIDQNVFTENGRFGCVYAATGGLIEIKKTVDGKKVNEQYLYYGVRERCHDENIKLLLKFNSVSEFPSNGDPTKIYVDTSTWKNYEWENSQYVEKNPVYFNEIRRIKVNFGNDLHANN